MVHCCCWYFDWKLHNSVRAYKFQSSLGHTQSPSLNSIDFLCFFSLSLFFGFFIFLWDFFLMLLIIKSIFYAPFHKKNPWMKRNDHLPVDAFLFLYVLKFLRFFFYSVQFCSVRFDKSQVKEEKKKNYSMLECRNASRCII